MNGLTECREPSPAPAGPAPEARPGCCGRACRETEAVAASPDFPASDAENSVGRAVYRIPNMDCPMEEALIRKKLEALPGLAGLEFNLMRRRLLVRHSLDSTETIEAALRSIGMTPEPLEWRKPGADDGAPTAPPGPWGRLAVAGTLAAASEAFELMGEWPLNGMAVIEWLPLALAVGAILLSGLATYKKGWIAVRNFDLNINALMSVAVTGAALIGRYPEAAMVMVLFNVAEIIEAKSLDRARKAIRNLLALAPERATVWRPDGGWAETEARHVAAGDRVRVRPGERVALDGIVLSGRSAVNQAPITGESLPVDKAAGDPVYAGSINESGSFEYRVTARADESTLARIIRAVEEAQAGRAPTQRFVDRFARVYTPVVFLVAILVAVLPPLFLAGDWHEWVYTALVILVIGCPCALVISTPVSIVSGLAAATRHGLLVKGGLFLEQGRRLAWLALDKTGTITHGRPRQTDFVLLNGLDRERAEALAASLAARSDHPVSRAIADQASERGRPRLEVADFAALPGRGVRGVIDGETWYLGNHRLLEDLKVCSAELEERLFQLEKEGKSVVALLNEKGPRALVAVADTIRDSSLEAIRELRKIGVRTMMLTGDNEHTARAVAEQAGVDGFQGNLLPADKLAAVERLARDGRVGMVGDGINDAPALARADIGFAMAAAGTDAAIETADVALMDDDLRKIPRFIGLSKSTHAILVQNIVLALGVKALFLGLTLAGQATMWMAVFADMGTSLLVVANGLRAMRK